MSDLKKVLFFAEGNLLGLLKDTFKDNDKYKIVGNTNKVSELNYYFSTHKRLVVLLGSYMYNEKFIEETLPTIKNENIKLIVICNNVKEGFSLLAKGADDMCIMPKDNNSVEVKSFSTSITMKVNKLYKGYDRKKRVLKNNFNRKIKKVVAIGSSTGGTECILQILKELPKDAPPILVVQHMPPVFTKLYSKRLNDESKITVWEAQNGDSLEIGLAFIAPGDKHMRLTLKNNKYIVSCNKENPVGGHIPSVDVLFNSVAEIAGKDSIGIILTGMGKDGVEGLLKMRESGALTIGQDKESSVVYGMPKMAYDMGAVKIQAKPEKIAQLIMDNI